MVVARSKLLPKFDSTRHVASIFAHHERKQDRYGKLHQIDIIQIGTFDPDLNESRPTVREKFVHRACDSGLFERWLNFLASQMPTVSIARSIRDN